jgi:hypothetical protein
MPVVINEFEVVAEAPPAPTATAAASAESAAETQPAPIDIEQIERFITERAARVWAH